MGTMLALGVLLVVLLGPREKIFPPYVFQSLQEKAIFQLNLTQEIHQMEAKCQKMFDELEVQKATPDNRPTLYIVTATYQRPQQISELTRLGQTLMLVPKIHWIVAEDAIKTNPLVAEFLKYSGIPFTYLLTPMPEKYTKDRNRYYMRGISNRNAAIDWIRTHAKEGVMYIADDDNTYDIRLFEQIRYTKKVSMFPVGLITMTSLSTPLLKDGKFLKWYTGYYGGREFPVDMAGFAVSIQLLLSVPNAKMPYKNVFQESGLLSNLKITQQDIEFLADNCTKLYVWHTRTEKTRSLSRTILDPKYDGTNLRQLQKFLPISKT